MRIDGKALAKELLTSLVQKVADLKKENIIPHLAIILVGKDPASTAYVRQKEKKAEEIGAKTTVFHLPNSISEEKLIALIEKLNIDPEIHGIIAQQPLPPQINAITIVQSVNPEKDVDGFCIGSSFTMPLANAVMTIFEYVYSQVKDRGDFPDWLGSKTIVVIGKGETGGGPIIQTLQAIGIVPIVIDSKTQHPEKLTKIADIIVSAVGKPRVITKENIKKGVLLISIGIHRTVEGKLRGDYEEDEVENIAAFYTPTPGGIGPVNVSMLLENLVDAAQTHRNV